MVKLKSDPDYTNPEVRFERSDIKAKGVAYFGIALGLGVLFVVGTMLWFGQVLLAYNHKPDPLDLPRATVDCEQLPPQPRLEAQEDLRDAEVELYPRRAEKYLGPQIRLLDRGNTSQGVIPIQEAMTALSRSHPVRKTGATAAPTTFTIRLPSKAAAGRLETGGQ